MGLSKKGIIVDTVAFHKFVDLNHQDSKPVHKCIKEQKLQLAIGNDEQSLNEISGNSCMLQIVKILIKNGAAHYVNSKEEKQEIDDSNKMIKGVRLKSNDTHIIAIALVEAKARLLFSVSKGDEKLHQDFTNSKIIKNPSGKVYKQYGSHSHLLPR